MAELWPRNIVPYDLRQLGALGDADNLRVYLAALEEPVAVASLTVADRARAQTLVDVGLLVRDAGRLGPTNRHRRYTDENADAPEQIGHKQAKVTYAATILDDARREIGARGAAAQAGIGVVTLPDTPDVLAQATTILAEAEDQLRALAEEHPPNGSRKARILIFVGSTPS